MQQVDRLGQQVDRLGGDSVVIWAGIYHGGRTALLHIVSAMRSIGSRDEIVQQYVIPRMNVDSGTFQHDNARPHVARASKE